MSSAGLEFLHNPSSVAIVGASDDPDKIGGRPIAFMKQYGFAGVILPVNPKRSSVQGLQAYPDLEALPLAPDVAVIAVPGQAAVEAVASCAARGVKAAIVMASGFGETGRPDDLRR